MPMTGNAGYIGNCIVPQERAEEFYNRAKTVLFRGGLMDLVPLKSKGTKISLLVPPEEGEDGRVRVSYNYLENTPVFPAYLTKNEPFLTTEMDGDYLPVPCRAIYLMKEFYSKEFALYHEQGEIANMVDIIGWLNYLFDEDYTNERVADMWRVGKLLHSAGMEEDNATLNPEWISGDSLMNKACISYWSVFAEDEIAKLVAYSTEETETNSFGIKPFALWIRDQQEALDEAVKAWGGDERAVFDRAKALLTNPAQLLEAASGYEGTPFCAYAKACKPLPFAANVKVLTKRFHKDFWATFTELSQYEKAYEDVFGSKTRSLNPVPKISIDYLLPTNSDNMLYWWREGGDIKLSPNVKRWLVELRVEHQTLMAEGNAFKTQEELVDALTDTLALLANSGDPVYAFRDMFMEYKQWWDRPDIQAHVILLRRLTERYWQGMSFGFEGRSKLYRYLAVLANKSLCDKVFG